MGSQALCHRRIKNVASLLEGIKSVRIQHLCPQVHVVLCSITVTSKEVQEMGGTVAGHNALGKSKALEFSCLKGWYINIRHVWRGVQRLIQQSRDRVLHRIKALVEGLRRLHAGNQLVRDGHPRVHVARVPLQDLLLREPVLVQLRGQLHKVLEDVGSCEAMVRHVGEHPMKAMPELVEQRCGIVEAEEGLLPRGGFGEVVVVHHDRHDAGPVRVAGLGAVRRHPGAALFVGAGEVVVQEDGNELVPVGRLLTTLVHLNVQVIDFDVGAGHEAQPEQAVGAVKGRRAHTLQ
mmetsp:Transcript_23488/g.40542  ORF Transcript_23488/g.40542 Transcript_23488/m.40542 type:complete len:291 (+) Transcript_23488:252-1124(+)